MSPGRVRASLHSDFNARFCVYNLSNSEFQTYRAAMDGAKYDRAAKAWMATLDRVPAILVRLRKSGLGIDADDMDPRLRTVLQERATTYDWLDLDAVKDRLARIEKGLHEKGESLFRYQRSGAQWLARGHGRLLADDMGLGKLASVHEPVLTPKGWSTMGALKVGSWVVGSKGKPVRVIGVYPQGRKALYRVTLTDGSWTRAGAEHLWYVETTNHRKRKSRGYVKTTRELMKEGLTQPTQPLNSRWFIPVVLPVSFSTKKLPCDPYFLGAMIANGCLTLPSIKHSGLPDQKRELRRALPEGYRLRPVVTKPKPELDAAIVRKSRAYPTMRRFFDGLHLCVKSPERFVPPPFLLGDVEQRLALLQGLMDNDGTVSKDGTVVEYNTMSPQLAEDVVALVRSLGGVARLTHRVGVKYSHKGEKRVSPNTDHRIRMCLPGGMTPFRLPRKVARFRLRGTKYPPAHAIAEIRRDGMDEAVCIRVATDDHLYVTRDFILTHNTVMTLVALPASSPVIIVCPSSSKGDWKAAIARWRPSLRAVILEGQNSFRMPQPGEAIITNYDILLNAHDREGVTGRACNGWLPSEPCPGCAKKIVFVEGMAQTQMIGHVPSCDGFLEKIPCSGCHPMLLQVPRGTVIVYDEAQYLKNGQSARHRHARALSDAIRARDGYVWLLTGTPLENEPNELWAILRVGTIHDEAFGSRERFEKVFRVRKSTATYAPGRPMSHTWALPGEEIREHLRRVMLRRLKKDVQPQLPPKLRKIHQVDLDKKTYRRIEESLAGTGRSVDEIMELLEREEISFEDMSSVRAALATAKIPRLLEIVRDFEAGGVPLIVFSDHRAPIDAVGKRPGWVVMTGSQTSEQKTRAKDEFQNGYLAEESEPGIEKEGQRRKVDVAGNILYPHGIALTIKAGGTGVTLTRASHMVFVDRAWNPQTNSQAEDRFVRIGQLATSVDIVDIVSDHPVDARVTEVIVKKMKLFEASINVCADRSAGADIELSNQLREEQEAIAAGRAVRRGATNGRERGAWEALHVLVFDDARDERIAAELAEQADTIGLSDKQWSFAIVITRKGRRPDEPPRVEIVTSPEVVPARVSVENEENQETTSLERPKDPHDASLSDHQLPSLSGRDGAVGDVSSTSSEGKGGVRIGDGASGRGGRGGDQERTNAALPGRNGVERSQRSLAGSESGAPGGARTQDVGPGRAKLVPVTPEGPEEMAPRQNGSRVLTPLERRRREWAEKRRR